MAKMGLMARPQGPEPTHFPRPDIVKQRIAIMPGCVQGALAPQIDAAVGRVLARRGIAVAPASRRGQRPDTGEDGADTASEASDAKLTKN